MKNVHNSNWELQEIQGATERESGCKIQIKEDQYLIFGGRGTNDFSILNLKTMKITKTSKHFNNYYYFGSKLRQFCGNCHNVSRNNGKRILISSIEKMECNENAINF